MKASLYKIYDILQAVLPVLLMLFGGLGTVYCIATYQTDKLFMVFSLLVLLAGLSLHTYQQVSKSELFKRRFGLKDKKGGSRHRGSGKRCPQCQRIIHHRRSSCQHCGYKFPSYKPEGQTSGGGVSEKDTPA